MKSAKITSTTMGLFALALAVFGCKESGIDARKTADALSEEFTDGIEFEDGTTEQGQPPESTVDDPRIWWVAAPHAIAPAAQAVPESVEFNQSFSVVIDASQPVDDGSVLGVIAHVQQANKDDQAARYIRVEPPAAAFVGQQVTLQARFVSANPIGGNAFHIRLALLMANGDVGPYKDWNVVTYPMTGETAKIEMCTCQYETTTRPANTGEPDATYEALTSTNLDLSNRCGGDFETDMISWEFNGYPGDDMESQWDASPCMLFHSCYGASAPMEQFLIPSGTRFRPYWLGEYGVAPDTCWVQINCR